MQATISKLASSLTSLPTHLKLASGDLIPSIALGLYQSPPNEAVDAIKVALKTGYRHFDTAWVYGNEEALGKAIRESDIPRNEIWVTTKLWNTFHTPADVEPTFNDSLNNLGLDYVDLYLMHWPVAHKRGIHGGSTTDQELSEDPYPTWQAMERLVESGKAKNIGVCNFNIRRLEKLMSHPLKVRPAINQVEMHFWNPQPEMVKWGQKNDVVIQAWGPLSGSVGRHWLDKALNAPEIKETAEELGMTPGQVIISWHIQRGTVVLPKSVTPSRIIENFQVAKLPDAAFERIEQAASAHPRVRLFDPSRSWGLDVFEEGTY